MVEGPEKKGGLLVVVAHPDDEGLVSGTMARCVERGKHVTLLTLTMGEAGKCGIPEVDTPEKLAELRRRELEEACGHLGVTDLRLPGFRDGRLQEEDEEKVLEEIVRIIRERTPEVMVTFGQDGIYGHPDHVAAGRYAERAFFASGDPGRFAHHLRDGLVPHRPRKLYYVVMSKSRYEVMVRLTGIDYVMLSGKPHPFKYYEDEDITVKLDVSPFLQKKMAAFYSHRSQAVTTPMRRKEASEKIKEFLATECFIRAYPSAPRGFRENDIFD